MANRKSRGPVGDSTYTCDYSIERGHGGMKQNRGNVDPITGDETTVSGNIFGISNTGAQYNVGSRPAKPVIPKHIAEPPSNLVIGEKGIKRASEKLDAMKKTTPPPSKPKYPDVGPTKERAAAAKKAARQQKMAVASKAMSDMAGKMQEDQQRFSQEHDQAVQEGSAMMQRQMAGRPGRAMEIIKRKRV